MGENPGHERPGESTRDAGRLGKIAGTGRVSFLHSVPRSFLFSFVGAVTRKAEGCWRHIVRGLRRSKEKGSPLGSARDRVLTLSGPNHLETRHG